MEPMDQKPNGKDLSIAAMRLRAFKQTSFCTDKRYLFMVVEYIHGYSSMDHTRAQ